MAVGGRGRKEKSSEKTSSGRTSIGSCLRGLGLGVVTLLVVLSRFCGNLVSAPLRAGPLLGLMELGTRASASNQPSIIFPLSSLVTFLL